MFYSLLYSALADGNLEEEAGVQNGGALISKSIHPKSTTRWDTLYKSSHDKYCRLLVDLLKKQFKFGLNVASLCTVLVSTTV